jgi:hypothetical protein
MIANRARDFSLRPDRFDLTRLVWALALSVALHLLLWGGYAVGKKFNLWERLPLPAWFQKLTQPVARAKSETKPPLDREPPLIFVDVSSAQATSEAPKDAPFYSDKNSQAANPEPELDTNVPKITGTQPDVPKTEDVERNKFDRLMPDPVPPAPEPEPEPVQVARANPAPPPGDLTLAKPELNPRPDTSTPARPRPRTIREAMARQPEQLPGRKLQQEGGVRRQQLVPSFDAKATPFGAYDRAFIDAVSSRWYDLLDNMSYDGYRRGKVVLQFNLNYDGRITEMNVMENTVTEMLSLLCQKAVLDPAPFDKWPREMRLMVGSDHRRITFTFYYH